MEIIETIKKKLKSYPQIRFEEGDGSITIFPASDDGFNVAVLEIHKTENPVKPSHSD